MIGGRCVVSAKVEGIRVIAAVLEPSCKNRRRSTIIFVLVLPAEGYRIWGRTTEADDPLRETRISEADAASEMPNLLHRRVPAPVLLT